LIVGRIRKLLLSFKKKEKKADFKQQLAYCVCHCAHDTNALIIRPKITELGVNILLF